MKGLPDQDWTCEVYLKAWVVGCREEDSFITQHVNECPFCRGIIHGGTDEFPISLVEETQQRLAAQRQLRRRRFLAAAAGGLVGLIGAAILGRTVIFNAADRQWTVDMANLDAFRAAQGDKGVIKAFAAANENDAINMLFWIRDRAIVSLYGVPVSALADSRGPVRVAAMAALGGVPAKDLVPYLPAIAAAADAETDQHVRAALTDLVAKIEGA